MRIQLFPFLGAIFALLVVASCDADGLDAVDPEADLDAEEQTLDDDEAVELDDEAIEDGAPELTAPAPNLARPKDGARKKCRAKCSSRYKGCMAGAGAKCLLERPGCLEHEWELCEAKQEGCLAGCELI